MQYLGSQVLAAIYIEGASREVLLSLECWLGRLVGRSINIPNGTFTATRRDMSLFTHPSQPSFSGPWALSKNSRTRCWWPWEYTQSQGCEEFEISGLHWFIPFEILMTESFLNNWWLHAELDHPLLESDCRRYAINQKVTFSFNWWLRSKILVTAINILVTAINILVTAKVKETTRT